MDTGWTGGVRQEAVMWETRELGRVGGGGCFWRLEGTWEFR
jgi:hypothetical protein